MEKWAYTWQDCHKQSQLGLRFLGNRKNLFVKKENMDKFIKKKNAVHNNHGEECEPVGFKPAQSQSLVVKRRTDLRVFPQAPFIPPVLQKKKQEDEYRDKDGSRDKRAEYSEDMRSLWYESVKGYSRPDNLRNGPDTSTPEDPS